MGPSHLTEHPPVQPTPPERSGRDNAWFKLRMDFQMELARRMMHVKELDDAAMMEWTNTHAARFAVVVDAKWPEGKELRRLIREDREAAFERVLQQMLH